MDLAALLTGLTVKQRAVVVLRYLEDRPVHEVAAALGIAEGTVKRQSHDALRVLRATAAPPWPRQAAARNRSCTPPQAAAPPGPLHL